MTEETEHDLGEMRVQMVENTQQQIDEYQDAAKQVHRLLHSSRRFSDPGNVQPFLTGVQVGLELAQLEVEDISRAVLRGPDEEDGDRDG